MEKKRDISFDIAKGIAIFLVVWGHVLQQGIPAAVEEHYIFKTIYAFHMPLFAVISGYFFYFSAKKLKELGAGDIYLYVTHCENTIFDGELITGDLIKHIYTTDSLLTKRDDKITVFDILV